MKMCKTIDELNSKLRKIEMESANEKQRLEEQIIALRKEIACMIKAQCAGCKHRTETCATGEN